MQRSFMGLRVIGGGAQKVSAGLRLKQMGLRGGGGEPCRSRWVWGGGASHRLKNPYDVIKLPPMTPFQKKKKKKKKKKKDVKILDCFSTDSIFDFRWSLHFCGALGAVSRSPGVSGSVCGNSLRVSGGSPGLSMGG